MRDGAVDVDGEVAHLRIDLAEKIACLDPDQWELASWCTGWRIRDVLGHLVQNAEASPTSMFWQITRNPVRPDRVIDRLARGFGSRPVPELLDRLRGAAHRNYHLPGTPSALGLGDLLIHSADVLRPVGIVTDPPIADVLVVLDVYSRWGRRVFHAAPHKDVSLSATDVSWLSGAGPQVRGKAIDLLLLMANRLQVIDRLDGPGIARLRRW